ncbi:MAG: hypothetical protein R3B96_11685 [Pirellulaceae bacterium]|nr:hypothetical protein [Planctomycetales bacterium]
MAADEFPHESNDVPFDVENDNLNAALAESSDELVSPELDDSTVDAVEFSVPEASEPSSESHDPFDFAGRNSQPFIGQWNRLVSRTNWDKGQIICEWRQSLVDAGAPATAYSDEVWSRLVGGVTSQHVGRLRRSWTRFGTQFESYAGLFWTHFQAALDWEDAEMWLQGAVDNRWSVSQMRRQRWETLGSVAAEEPQDDEIVAVDLDEDFEPAKDSSPDDKFDEATAGPLAEGPDFGDSDDGDSPSSTDSEAIDSDSQDVSGTALAEAKPAFEQVGKLPDDLADALQLFQLAIIAHRTTAWSDVSPKQVLAAIEGLKKLVLSDAEGRLEVEA